MANLFNYIDEIREVGGHEGLLEAGSPVMARTRQGYEPVGTPLEEPTLVGALTSVLTSEQQVDLAVGNIIQFPVERPSGRWHVLIESTGSGLRVRMRGPALETERTETSRATSLTPAIRIETPADSMSRFAVPLGADVERESDESSEVADPFVEAAESDDAEGSISGIHEQPDWDVPSAEDEDEPAATGTRNMRETLSEVPEVGHPPGVATDEQPDVSGASQGGGVDPFLVEDDLDDEFEIEDPFADFGGVSTSVQAETRHPVENEDDSLDDARSPFDFDDEELRGGGTQAVIEVADERPDLVDTQAGEPGPDADCETATEEEESAVPAVEDEPQMVSTSSDVQIESEECESVAHESAIYDAMATGFGAEWSIIAHGGGAAALLNPIPTGALCHLLGGVSLEGNGLDLLSYTESDDEATFRAASRVLVPGRVLCLDVEDPSAWLTWVGRRLEGGSSVLVRSGAMTAEGAWRCLVGLQSRNRAEGWFAEHPQYALYVTDEGYAIARRRVK